MTRQWQGRLKGAITFLIVAMLVIGGLGWVTWSALRVEEAQQDAAAEARLVNQLRLALWRLDSGMIAPLGLEDNRPYDHYAVICSPLNGWNGNTDAVANLRAPSPLVSCPVPDWMSLHFQVDAKTGFTSPQVPTAREVQEIRKNWDDVPIGNITDERCETLGKLNAKFDVAATVSVLAARESTLLGDATPLAMEPVRTAPPTVPPVTNRELSRWHVWGFDIPPPRTELAPPRGSPQIANNALPDLYSQQASIELLQNPSQGVRYTVKNSQELQQSNEFNTRANIVQRSMNDQKQAFEQGVYLKNTIGNTGTINFSSPAVVPSVPPIATPPVSAPFTPSFVHLGALRPQWLKAKDGSEQLALVRSVRLDHKTVYQGVLLDWDRLRTMLCQEVKDLFPSAHFVPVMEGANASPERAMTTLPVQLEPGPLSAVARDRWSPLRIGLALAWAAALLALAAVGLGGWSLLDLSERRIRFVSAVTHELRTPLTSLRLYLDMLTSGMITDEAKKVEYLQTLNCESERLHRLIDNVLNYARLENRAIRPEKRAVPASELLQQIRDTWQDRCVSEGRDLQVESTLPDGGMLSTDANLVQQIVGNLIDNARKYSKEAADNRIWLRARAEGGGVVFEVEDRGPGIPDNERARIFRPFRRGENADTTAGGAGLGLALARQWANALGGTLTFHPGVDGGACFRLELR